MARAANLGWWALWFVCGVALVLGAVSLPFLLLLPVLAGVITRGQRGGRQALVAGPLGAAAALLFIAYLNRGPDGSTCTVEGTTTTCNETLNALPWVVLAVLAITIAAAIALRGRDRSHP
jgi:hypothetical protein